MSLTQSNNRGAVFKKDKTNANQPDYKGDALISGVRYWVSGWIEGEGENRRLSMTFTPMDDDKEL